VSFLNSKYALVLTGVLLLQVGAYYAAELRQEQLPAISPLARFPAAVEEWSMIQETVVEREVLDVLKADDTLSRVYLGPQGKGASLFVAFFKTQRTGQAPHSPKNCLPGSGWEPSATGFLTVNLPGSLQPAIHINRYVVSRGEEKSVVLYWYQSHGRVIASEFSAKFWLVADSIRHGRSDTALVRVVVPVRGSDEETATTTGVSFIQALFPALVRQFPA